MRSREVREGGIGYNILHTLIRAMLRTINREWPMLHSTRLN